jgi:hypothetical protein
MQVNGNQLVPEKRTHRNKFIQEGSSQVGARHYVQCQYTTSAMWRELNRWQEAVRCQTLINKLWIQISGASKGAFRKCLHLSNLCIGRKSINTLHMHRRSGLRYNWQGVMDQTPRTSEMPNFTYRIALTGGKPLKATKLMVTQGLKWPPDVLEQITIASRIPSA